MNNTHQRTGISRIALVTIFALVIVGAAEGEPGADPAREAEEVRAGALANQPGDEIKSAAQDVVDAALGRDWYSGDLSWLRPAEEAFRSGMQEAKSLVDEMAQATLQEESFMDRARRVVMAGVESRQGHGQPKRGEPLYVLTTLALGRDAILNHLKEAEPMEMPVIFVLRGFDPDKGGIQATVESILDINQEEIEFEMHINPTMFRQTEAERGPVFIRRGPDGVTRVRRGAVNVHAALESLESPDLDLLIGETVEITEPDLLTIIEERIAAFEHGEELIAEARQRASKALTKSRVMLPVAAANVSYLVNPAISVERDITLPTGQVVVPRGATVNPLDTSPWDMQVVVFDATVEWQVNQARQWAREVAERTIFITTQLPEKEEERLQLGADLDAHVNLLDDLVVRRMDLRYVPSRVRQDGRMVRVDVVAAGEGL